MGIFQLPVIEATIHVTHSGPVDGESFTTTLDAVADNGPSTPQSVYVFDLTVFAPDLVAMAPAAPLVGVFREPSGEQVQVDVEIADQEITVRFFEPVVPSEYRIKVMG